MRTKPKDYSQYCIPPDVLRFFSEESGLNPEMLVIDSYLGPEKLYCCDMINTFKRVTFPLIKFYLKTPQLSVENLLNYHPYAIRDFSIHDKDFHFHQWLLENQLTMPPALVTSGLGAKWHNISALCDCSGIEYLNRSILTLRRDERQSKLNELVKHSCIGYKEVCLHDSLVPRDEVRWDTVENRFLKFKEKEKATAKKHTRGAMSLMWLSAKKVSETFTQAQIDELPEKIQLCVKAAHPF